MKRRAFLAALAGLPATVRARGSKSDAARVFGKIQFVTSFSDFKVEVVESFPDLNVEILHAAA